MINKAFKYGIFFALMFGVKLMFGALALRQSKLLDWAVIIFNVLNIFCFLLLKTGLHLHNFLF